MNLISNILTIMVNIGDVPNMFSLPWPHRMTFDEHVSISSNCFAVGRQSGRSASFRYTRYVSGHEGINP
jgi:hypothetical protein